MIVYNSNNVKIYFQFLHDSPSMISILIDMLHVNVTSPLRSAFLFMYMYFCVVFSILEKYNWNVLQFLVSTPQVLHYWTFSPADGTCSITVTGITGLRTHQIEICTYAGPTGIRRDNTARITETAFYGESILLKTTYGGSIGVWGVRRKRWWCPKNGYYTTMMIWSHFLRQIGYGEKIIK